MALSTLLRSLKYWLLRIVKGLLSIDKVIHCMPLGKMAVYFEKGSRTLFVRNLHPSISFEYLNVFFSQFGPLEQIEVPRHTDGSSLNFALVVFKNRASVNFALKVMNYLPIYKSNPRRVYVNQQRRGTN